VLLLHGYPENHLMWRHVAPVLARDHTVVVADLRGYGDSGKPAPDAAGLLYCKRFMARDQVGLMRQLGFGQFQLVGHDRGAASCTGWPWTTLASSPGSPSWTSCRPGMCWAT
jgi:haloacetate dehalogenase